MNNKNNMSDFHALRNRLLSDMILAIAILGIPGVAISLLRATTIGFQNFMAVQIFLVLALWILWLRRDHISYTLRAAGLLATLAVATFAALSQLGPASDSKAFMLLFAFASMLFFNSRTAWLFVIGIIAAMSLFAYAAVQHWISFEIDYKTYAHHPMSWLTTIWVMGVMSSTVAYLGWRMIHGIQQQTSEKQELSNRLQLIADRVPGMVYQYRLYPDGRSCFPYASEAINDIYKVSPEQVRDDASRVFDIIHPDDYQKIYTSIIHSAQQLTPWQQEYRVRYHDGHERWLFGNASPQREEDGGTLWHGFITDITERKLMERLKDDFVSTVSHELRTPLTAIRGSIKLINSGALDNQQDHIQQLLTIAEHNAERLLFLINDLLDIEKLERGTYSLNMSQFAIEPFMHECIEENQPFAKQYKTHIILCECNNNTISADRQRLKQVMSNLLSNASKFSKPDKAVEVFVRQDDGGIVINIKDYGDGIPDDFQDKIFEKFSQADSSSTRSVSGTGLGLSIAKRIIELHHGEISFDTVKNTGTTFSVRLPQHPPNESKLHH